MSSEQLSAPETNLTPSSPSSPSSSSSSITRTLTSQEICKLLEDGYQDFIIDGDNDFLSYSIIIDDNITRSVKLDSDSRSEILEKLLEILTKNEELIANIGWDLPSILIKSLVSREHITVGVLSGDNTLKSCFKIFDLLAKKGNAKELFLKGCELLESLSFQDENEYLEWIVYTLKDGETDVHEVNYIDDDTKEKLLNLKFHTLFELTSASFRRIKTNYPSKFLTMFMSSVIKFFNNNVVYVLNTLVVMRRIYTFCRDYISPTPNDVNLDPKIREDEEYLQSKLLLNFLTTGIEVGCKYYRLDLTITYYQKLVEKNVEKKYQTSSSPQGSLVYNRTLVRDSISPLLTRYYELCQSYDLDMKHVIEDGILQDTRTLYKVLQNTVESQGKIINFEQEEEFVKQIFEITNKVFGKAISGSVEDEEIDSKKHIPVNYIGTFYIFTFEYYKQLIDSNDSKTLFESKRLALSMEDLIFLSLRYLIPVLTIRESRNSETLPYSRDHRNHHDLPEFEEELTEVDELSSNAGDDDDDEENEQENEQEDKETPEVERYWNFINANYKYNIPEHYTVLQDSILLWSWSYIDEKSNEIKALTVPGSVSSIYSRIYLQCLISLTQNKVAHLTGVDQNNRYSTFLLGFKKLVLTFILKFLTASHEKFSWTFLVGTLENCPYVPLKIDMINILRDLCLQKRADETQLNESVKDLSIDKDNQPPKLPPRPIELKQGEYYINLNISRKLTLLGLIYRLVDDLSDEDDNATIVGHEDLSEKNSSEAFNEYQLLLSFLNLIYHLKKQFSKDELRSLLNKVKSGLEKVNDDHNDNNMIGLLKLFNGQLEDYISRLN